MVELQVVIRLQSSSLSGPTLGWCGALLGLLLAWPGWAQENDIPNPFELLPPLTAEATEVVSHDEAVGAEIRSNEQFDEGATTEAAPQPRPAGLESPTEGSPAAGITPLAPTAQAEQAKLADESVAPNEAVGPAGADVAAGVDEEERVRVDLAEAVDRDAVLEQAYRRAYWIELDAPIFGKFRWFLQQRLAQARRQGADLVILSLTTPGGDLEYSLELARTLRDIDWATTMVFIPEEAISGGAIIALGADRIYMREGALIGDAGPIRMGLGGQFEHAEEKVVSYLAEAIHALADAKNRPGALAEAMVDRNLRVYEATSLTTGETVFLTEKETQVEGIRQQFKIGPVVPETGQNRFLTLDALRARELGFCEGLFASESEFLAALNLKTLERTELSWVDTLVYWLNRPWLTGLLLIIGLVGLYLELAAPGISVAGLTAIFCFGIFFWSHALGGTSGWLEIVLFILGIGCVVCELFVLPGFGVFGISGLALIVLSLVMASQNFVVPSEPAQWRLFQTNLLIVLGSVLGVLLLLVVQVFLLDSIPGLNRLKLSAPGDEPVEADFHLTSLVSPSGQTRCLPTLGMRGVADSDLRPSGKVLVADGLLDVVTEGDYVDAGSQVEIIRIEGNRIVVRKRAET